jgi:hypothetical protein
MRPGDLRSSRRRSNTGVRSPLVSARPKWTAICTDVGNAAAGRTGMAGGFLSHVRMPSGGYKNAEIILAGRRERSGRAKA